MTALLVLPALLLLSLLTLSRPKEAYVLLVGILPTYLIRFSVFALPTNFFEAAVVVVFFSSLLNVAARRSWRVARHNLSPYPRFLIGAFVLASIISTATSPDVIHSLGILKGWIITPLMLGWLIFAWRCSPFLSVSESTPALYQKTNTPFKLNNSDLVSIAPLIRSLVLSGNVMGLIGLTQINNQARITSLYDVPNSLALYLVPLLVISVWLSFTGWQRSFYFPSTVILAAAVTATQSVGGLASAALAVTLGLFIPFFFQSSAVITRSIISRWILVGAFLVVSVAYLLSTGRLAYLSQPFFLNPSAYNSVSVRQQLWSVGFDLVKENPILGVGLGTFELAYQQQLHERFSQFDQCQQTETRCTSPLPEFVFRDPHNWFLSFWLNTGLLGLLSFILLNGYVFYATRSFLRPANISLALSLLSTKQNQPTNTRLLQALVLALFSLIIFGLFDTIYWKNDLSALYWLIIFFLI